MAIARYKKPDGTDLEIEYDENAPCIICGEPVIAASMGGTVICPGCDCGKCRYCGMTIMVFKPEIDDGRSKEAVLKHMEWHKKHNPELVEKINAGLRIISADLEVRRKLRVSTEGGKDAAEK